LAVAGNEAWGVIRGILQPQHNIREAERRIGGEPSQYRAEQIMIRSIYPDRDPRPQSAGASSEGRRR
jgi:hypothetical protein